jgi:hypothetical protein
MTVYCQEVCKLEDMFEGLELHHILRRDNEAADSLVRLASSRGPTHPGVFISDVTKSSVQTDGDEHPTTKTEPS